MSHSVLLVPHQNLYIQSYSNFPDIRWHMLVTGFGGGKTRANVMLCLKLIKELQGMKDRAGDGARIIVAGYTLAHLAKTFILYFLSYLNSSKTEFTYDRKNNIAYVGTVTIIFLPMENPDDLFGEDACACFDKFTKVLTRDEKRNILSVSIENLHEGDEVLTRQGWKKVLAVHDNGWKDCINVKGIWCTPDHKWASDGWIHAEDITPETPLYTIPDEEVELCQQLTLGRNRLLQTLRSLMESDTTDTLILNQAIRGIITGVKTIRLIILHCGKSTTESCLKDIVSIIRTSTVLTIALTILKFLRLLNITAYMLRDSRNRGSIQQLNAVRNVLLLLESVLRSRDVTECVFVAEGLLEVHQKLSTVLSSAGLSIRQGLDGNSMEQKNTRSRASIVEWCSILSERSSAQHVVEMLTNMRTDLPVLNSLRVGSVPSAEKSSCAQGQGRPQGPVPTTARTSSEVRRCHVYDITVEDCHEYFVGGSDAYYCVHNCIQEESDELPEATLIEACKALSERTRQQIVGFRSPFICLGTTSQGQSGLYRLYCQFIKQGTAFVLIRGRTQDNFYLPKEQIVDLYKLYDETERRVFLNGEFLMVNKGRVFPGFTWEHNYIDDDMDLRLKRGERVYIGMDFNCIAEGSRVETIYGPKQIEHIEVGDLVLTRKGYKHVLTKKSKGVKIVREYGGLWATPDHPVITPEGDVEICKAQRLYCLKEQYTEESDSIRNMTEALEGLRLYCSMEQYGEDTLTLREKNLFTSMEEEQPCTEQYMRNLWNLFQKACRSIIPMEETTTDLRVLFFCLPRNIQDCIRNWQEGISEKNHGNTLTEQLKSMLITSLMKDGLITQDTLKRYGEAVGFVVQWCAEIAAESLKLKSARHSGALSAVESTGMKASGNLTEGCDRESIHQTRTALRQFVSYAERRLSEAAQPVIVRNIEVIGNAQGMSERESEVFDIEVEDAHEFFAEGVLVHNCGYSRASAWVVRDDTCHCVKSYDFPDAADAPDVFRHDFPTQDIFWIPDVTTKDSYPQYARALRRNNIHIIHRSKNPIVEDTAFLVSVLCKSGRIMFHKMAREAADAIARAARDKDGKIGKGKAPSDWQHYADGVRYAVSYIALVNPEFKDIRRTLIAHIASLRREVEKDEEPVRKLKAGYTQIDGDAFFRKEGLTLKKKSGSL